MPSFDPFDAFAELVVCVVFHMPRNAGSARAGSSNSDEESPELLAPQASLRNSFHLDGANCCVYYNPAGSGVAGSNHSGSPSCAEGGGGVPSQRDSLTDLYDLCHLAGRHHISARAAAAQAFSRPSSIGSFISVGPASHRTTVSTPLSQTVPASPPAASAPAAGGGGVSAEAGAASTKGGASSVRVWPFMFRQPNHTTATAAATTTAPARSASTPPSPSPLAAGPILTTASNSDVPRSPATMGGSTSFIPITEEDLAGDLMTPGDWTVDAHMMHVDAPLRDDLDAFERGATLAAPASRTPQMQHLTVPSAADGGGGGAAGGPNSSYTGWSSCATSPSRRTPAAEWLVNTRHAGAARAAGENPAQTPKKDSAMPSGYTSISEFVEI